jgi:hypothetical protein
MDAVVLYCMGEIGLTERNKEITWKESCWLMLVSISTQVDVVSDFVYWYYVDTSADLDHFNTNDRKIYSMSILAFALIGFFTMIF